MLVQCLLVIIIIIITNIMMVVMAMMTLRHILTKLGKIALNCDPPSSVSLLARKLACATKPAFCVSLL